MIIAGKRLNLNPSEPVLKQIRLSLGLSQSKLAQLLGVYPSTVNRWERGLMMEALTLKQVQILEELLSKVGLTFRDFPAPTFSNPSDYSDPAEKETNP